MIAEFRVFLAKASRSQDDGERESIKDGEDELAVS